MEENVDSTKGSIGRARYTHHSEFKSFHNAPVSGDVYDLDPLYDKDVALTLIKAGNVDLIPRAIESHELEEHHFQVGDCSVGFVARKKGYNELTIVNRNPNKRAATLRMLEKILI